MKNSASWRIWIVVATLVIASVGGGMLFSEYNRTLPPDAVATYVGGQKCILCHQEQAASFHHSHHDLAMDVANSDTVLGKFDGSKIEHYGVTSTVFMDGDRYMVNTEGPDGSLQDFEVTMVFGYEPLQQYMVEIQPASRENALGQFQVLRISWDVINQKWFYLSPPDVDEKLEPGDPLHWTGVTQRWNTNCASCHSTNLQKNFDQDSNRYATTFTDIDVNCEACHGPGSLHVQIAEQRTFFWDKNHGLGLAKLKTTSNVPQVETCAPCHSRRTEICSGFQAGQRFSDYHALQLLSDQIYHDDGQIRDEDYVYGSFIQSKMFHKGIRCTDCHDPHSAKLKHDGNQVCTSCHQHPAGKYDSPAHHRHAVGSTGALCVECHMPATTYMAIDERRDHSFRVPRPDLSVQYGTPNACTACHLDQKSLPPNEQSKLTQYLDWIIESENGNEAIAAELKKVNLQMADAFKQWYPDAATRNDRSKYYEQLTAAKSSDDDAFEIAAALATDVTAPNIFRASAVEAIFDRGSLLDKNWLAENLDWLLDDPDPGIVVSALRLLEQQLREKIDNLGYSGSDQSLRLNVISKLEKIAALLAHENRHVRIAAASTISTIPIEIRSMAGRKLNSEAAAAALDEYRQSLRLTSDLAASNMTLGAIYESENKLEKAQAAYRAAIAVEPEFSGPRSNLAAILEQRSQRLTSEAARGNNSNALAKLITDLNSEAKQLRVRENQVLRNDVTRAGDLPAAHGLYYRYGLSSYLTGDLETAETYLKKAYDGDPQSTTYTLGLAAFYNQSKNFKAALPLVNQLLKSDPNNPGFQSLRDEVLRGNSKK